MQTQFIRQMHASFVEMQRICPHLRTPYFEAIILHVDQATSVARQQSRAATAIAQNAAAAKGEDSPPAIVRDSDLCAAACARRYALYEESLPDALQLREKIPVHMIDCSPSAAASRDAIARALIS